MEKRRFKHRQGSIYNSKEEISRADVHKVIYEMAQAMPWLYKCVTIMDLSIIKEVGQDLGGLLKEATLSSLAHTQDLSLDLVPDSSL